VRVVFAGSAEFSVPVLRALLASDHEVVQVLTAPEGTGSRGARAARPVRAEAESQGLPVEQPPHLTPRFWQDSPARLQPEALVVAAYGQLLPGEVLQTLPHGGLGVHPSLLPRHRGASPVAAAILSGDSRTGVTVFRMGPRMDSGPILAQQAVPLPATATTPDLTGLLAQLGAPLLLQVLDDLESGQVREIPQLESAATYSHRLGRQDGRLEWTQSSEQLDRQLRALHPWPGVTIPLAGSRVKLLQGASAQLPEAGKGAAPGEILGRGSDWILVHTSDSAFRVELIQPPGSRPMSPSAFLRGRPRGTAEHQHG